MKKKQKIKIIKKKYIYSGALYEIWNIIKKKLVEKKVIESYKETFVGGNRTDTTYKEAFNYVANGKYDICIGNFSIVESRINAMFTRPIYLNKYCIAYLPNESNYLSIAKAVFIGFLRPVLLGVFLTLIIILLFRFTSSNYIPKKWKVEDYWLIMTAIVFRATGPFSSKNPVNFAIQLLSLLFWVYIIGEMTTTLGGVKKKLYNNKVDTDSIIGTEILTPRGYSSSKHWKKYGAYIKENETKDILEAYKKNKDSYFGFYDDLEVLKLMKKDNPELIISNENFGFDELAWPMTKNEKLFKVYNAINSEIIIAQNNNSIINICRTYFINDAYLCEL